VWIDDSEPSWLCVYDVAAARLTRIVVKSGRTISCPAVSPDGKMAACFDGEVVYLFDSRTGKQIRTAVINTFFGSYNCRFLPDGKSVLVMATRGAVLVPTDPAQQVVESQIETGFLERWALFPDSRRVAVIDHYGVVRIHDLKTGKQLDDHSRFPAFAG